MGALEGYDYMHLTNSVALFQTDLMLRIYFIFPHFTPSYRPHTPSPRESWCT
jgi:hypothetical protein